MSQLYTAAATAVLSATVFLGGASFACSNPETGANNPLVSGHEASAEPGPVPVFDSALVVVGWTPSIDSAGDPGTMEYLGHDGHGVATRVVISDAITGEVALDVSVPQYDYANAQPGVLGAPTTSFAAVLPAGQYEARVQSVFTRHDEIRFGMSGGWQKMTTVTQSPEFEPEVQVARFEVVTPARAEEPQTAGCTAAGELAPGLSLVMALALLARRRARAHAHH